MRLGPVRGVRLIALLGALVSFALLVASCYRCDGPTCSNIPSVIQPDYPARARDAGRE